ncbi:YciI family protein [Nocardia aurantia]|uniref:YCII-related domain-containing protein n=1 Tax=Nocardia aurantia TaxID=2585199 RepID=A0A7K0E199_9NOCA|nr:YciI family protein [Nocardia aurantia]MQY31839.1 hypothetical protein [Nocardia aurantia]
MALFTLVYRYVDDDELVTAHRPEHRSYLRDLAEAGELVLAGPFGGPGPAGGLLVLNVASGDRAIEIADRDPFTHRGVIADRSIRSWTLSITPDGFPPA